MANYITLAEEKALESVLGLAGISAEQKAIVEKLLKKEQDTVYACSYDKDTVIDQIFDIVEQDRGEKIDDPCAFEEKVLGFKPFWTDLFDDLMDYEGFPEWDNLTTSIRNMFDKNFELNDGKLYIRGLAD